MLNSDIAIDFGTANFRIYLEGKGVIVNEPSFMAVDNRKDEVVGTGREAYQMLGRTASNITVESPFISGAVSNYPMAEHMLTKYIKRIGAGRIFLPNAVVSASLELTEVERHALVDIIEEAGIRKISFIDEPMAAALGAGEDVFGVKGIMVIDAGYAKTTASVIASGEILVSKSIETGGKDFDEAIIRYMRRKYGVEIGKLSAEIMKLEIGSAAPREKLMYCHARGKDINTDMPKDVTVTSDDMVAALVECTGRISDLAAEVLSQASTTIVGDIAENGMRLVGGTAKLFGLNTMIARKTGVRTDVDDDAQNAVISGAGTAIGLLGKSRSTGLFKRMD